MDYYYHQNRRGAFTTQEVTSPLANIKKDLIGWWDMDVDGSDSHTGGFHMSTGGSPTFDVTTGGLNICYLGGVNNPSFRHADEVEIISEQALGLTYIIAGNIGPVTGVATEYFARGQQSAHLLGIRVDGFYDINSEMFNVSASTPATNEYVTGIDTVIGLEGARFGDGNSGFWIQRIWTGISEPDSYNTGLASSQDSIMYVGRGTYTELGFYWAAMWSRLLTDSEIAALNDVSLTYADLPDYTDPSVGLIDKSNLVMWHDFAGDLENKHNPGILDGREVGGTVPFHTDPFGNPSGAIGTVNATPDIYVDIDDNALLNPSDFSIVTWVNDSGGDHGSHYFLSHYASASDVSWYLNWQGNTFDRIGLAISDDGVNTEVNYTPVGSYSGNNGWIHFAVTYDLSENNALYYRDGQLVHSGVYVTETGKLNDATSKPYRIGTLDGSLGLETDFARHSFWSRALTSGEINTLYNNGNDLRYSDL